jgi:hypothetical protein
MRQEIRNYQNDQALKVQNSQFIFISTQSFIGLQGSHVTHLPVE